MKKSHFVIPIAFNKETDKPCNARDVRTGAAGDCYCPVCKEDVYTAEGPTRKVHFKHYPGTLCSQNFETYIHYITKIAFEEIKCIWTPAITLKNSGFEYYEKTISQFKNFVAEHNLIDSNTAIKDIINANLILKTKTEVKITNTKKEVTRNSGLGNIRVDVVSNSPEHELFIEPFFTSPIGSEKYKKLANINVTTISINLLDYAIRNNYLFSFEELKYFLINDIPSKKWEYINDVEFLSLTDQYLSGISELAILEFKTSCNKREQLKGEIEENRRKSFELLNQQKDLVDELNKFKTAVFFK